MKNYDLIITILGFAMFILGWIASSIAHNQKKRKLEAEIEEIKAEANTVYLKGWDDGWESLAMNTEAMRRELTRENNKQSPHRP